MHPYLEGDSERERHTGYGCQSFVDVGDQQVAGRQLHGPAESPDARLCSKIKSAMRIALLTVLSIHMLHISKPQKKFKECPKEKYHHTVQINTVPEQRVCQQLYVQITFASEFIKIRANSA